MAISATIALLAFGAITLFALGVEIMYTYATQGIGFGFSSNRPPVTLTPLGRRIARAYANQVESAAYTVPVLVAAIALNIETPAAQLAATAIVAGRFMVRIVLLHRLAIRAPHRFLRRIDGHVNFGHYCSAIDHMKRSRCTCGSQSKPIQIQRAFVRRRAKKRPSWNSKKAGLWNLWSAADVGACNSSLTEKLVSKSLYSSSHDLTI